MHGNHCAAFIDSPFARTGILEGNPIHRDMEAAARGMDDLVLKELEEIRKVITVPLKVIIESPTLTEDELKRACQLVAAAKMDYVKTGTGFFGPEPAKTTSSASSPWPTAQLSPRPSRWTANLKTWWMKSA